MDQRHDVDVADQSLLSRITGCLKGAVNSSHHQCVDAVGTSLCVSARAEDPIVEAMEYSDSQQKPFYLGVQVNLSVEQFIRFDVSFRFAVASRTNGRSAKSIFIEYPSSIHPISGGTSQQCSVIQMILWLYSRLYLHIPCRQ